MRGAVAVADTDGSWRRIVGCPKPPRAPVAESSDSLTEADGSGSARAPDEKTARLAGAGVEREAIGKGVCGTVPLPKSVRPPAP